VSCAETREKHVQALAHLLRDIHEVKSSTAQPVPCTAGESELWFSDLAAEIDRAKSLCRGCPQREPCLAGALARREPQGVWGGEQFTRGRVRGPRRRRTTKKSLDEKNP
jgi:WhiB family redox-sensing transcriptional regulator